MTRLSLKSDRATLRPLRSVNLKFETRCPTMVFSDSFRMGDLAESAAQTVPDKARQTIKASPIAGVVRSDRNLLFDALRFSENCLCLDFMLADGKPPSPGVQALFAGGEVWRSALWLAFP